MKTLIDYLIIIYGDCTKFDNDLEMYTYCDIIPCCCCKMTNLASIMIKEGRYWKWMNVYTVKIKHRHAVTFATELNPSINILKEKELK